MHVIALTVIVVVKNRTVSKRHQPPLSHHGHCVPVSHTNRGP